MKSVFEVAHTPGHDPSFARFRRFKAPCPRSTQACCCPLVPMPWSETEAGFHLSPAPAPWKRRRPGHLAWGPLAVMPTKIFLRLSDEAPAAWVPGPFVLKPFSISVLSFRPLFSSTISWPFIKSKRVSETLPVASPWQETRYFFQMVGFRGLVHCRVSFSQVAWRKCRSRVVSQFSSLPVQPTAVI